MIIMIIMLIIILVSILVVVVVVVVIIAHNNTSSSNNSNLLGIAANSKTHLRFQGKGFHLSAYGSSYFETLRAIYGLRRCVFLFL